MPSRRNCGSFYNGYHYVELKGIPHIYVSEGAPLWTKQEGVVCYKIAGATSAQHWNAWKGSKEVIGSGNKEVIGSSGLPHCIEGFASVHTRGIAEMWTTTGTHVLKNENGGIQYKIIGAGRKKWTTLEDGSAGKQEYMKLRWKAARVKAHEESKGNIATAAARGKL